MLSRGAFSSPCGFDDPQINAKVLLAAIAMFIPGVLFHISSLVPSVSLGFPRGFLDVSGEVLPLTREVIGDGPEVRGASKAP